MTTPVAIVSPSPSPAPGPCHGAPLASVAIRPGIGRAPSTGGAVCVAAPGDVVVGFGYRDQVTVGGGSQELIVAPAPVALVGLRGRNELIVAPGLAFSRRLGMNASGLPPGSGQQDAGVGFQHLLADRPWTQQAVAAFITVPTGYPAGPSGFSSGAPSFQLSHTIAIALGARASVMLSQAVVAASGAAPSGAMQHYLAYVPTGVFTYATSPTTTLLLQDQITAPSGPHGTTGNRALAGVQQTLSPNVVLDVEYEQNMLPTPGVRQHTVFEAGLTVKL
ncbi:MAG TPA: hypothetical protein VGN14_00105 [Candidatus Elarobacter sp.]|jgi:hypothetical protein